METNANPIASLVSWFDGYFDDQLVREETPADLADQLEYAIQTVQSERAEIFPALDLVPDRAVIRAVGIARLYQLDPDRAEAVERLAL